MRALGLRLQPKPTHARGIKAEAPGTWTMLGFGSPQPGPAKLDAPDYNLADIQFQKDHQSFHQNVELTICSINS